MKETLHKLLNLAAEATGIRALPDILKHPGGVDTETLKLRGRYQTQPHTCGAVAGIMILDYLKPGCDAEAFFRSANPTPAKGTSVAKLIRSLRKHGVSVSHRTGMVFADFVDAIDRQRPIAVVVNTDDADAAHWVVCYGYGKKPNRVFIAGTGLPLVSRKEYPWLEFRKYHWAFVGEGLVCGKQKPRAKARPV